MEDDLLFVLSSSDRLTLLSEIKKEKLRLTQLAQRLSATAQGTSRHLGRLSEARLIEKDSDGLYNLTAFGKIVLDSLPSLSFISKNRSYFLSHDLSSLPFEFIHRIGELADSEYVEHLSETLRTFERIMTEAEQWVRGMIDEPPGGPRILEPILESNVSFKVIMNPVDDKDLVYGNQWVGPKWELRLFDGVKVGVIMSERMAAVSFSDLNGKLDLSSGFRGHHSMFYKWCYDLFTYHWNMARKWYPGRHKAQSI